MAAITQPFPAHHQVGATMVAGDDSLVQQFPVPLGQGHQRTDAEQGGRRGKAGLQGLACPDAAEVGGIVYRVGTAAHLDQQVGLPLHRGPQVELVVHAVHGVAGHHPQHPTPSPLGELGPGLGGGQPQGQEIMPGRQSHPLHRAGHVHLFGLAAGHGYRGSGEGSELGLSFRVHRPDLADMQHSGHETFRIPQGDLAARRQPLGRLLTHRQHYGSCPESAIRQLHTFQHALEICLAHVAGERCQGARQDQLQFTELLPVQVDGRIVKGLLFQGLGTIGVTQQHRQFAAIGRDQVFHDVTQAQDRL